MLDNQSKVRIDKYLWAIRILKTRSLASEACKKGRVKLQGNAIKASKIVLVNDEYEIKTESRNWVIKVKSIIQQRVQYSEAIKNYIDLTPEEEINKSSQQSAAFYTGKRLSKTGKPTKKERRNWEDLNL
jgi:ribosome-associated heat shock protein Hsp15